MRVVVMGAGGHARVLLDAVRLEGRLEVVGVLDPQLPANSMFEGLPILGDDSYVANMGDKGVAGVLIGVGSTTVSDKRKALYMRVLQVGLSLPVVRHPRATIADTVKLGSGSVVFAGSVINAGTQIGVNAIINTGALIDHDCRIGDHVHIGPGAHIAGGVHVGDQAHVGIGSTIIQGVVIGPRALVAAGAVVIDDVSAGIHVRGVPARPFVRHSC